MQDFALNVFGSPQPTNPPAPAAEAAFSTPASDSSVVDSPDAPVPVSETPQGATLTSDETKSQLADTPEAAPACDIPESEAAGDETKSQLADTPEAAPACDISESEAAGDETKSTAEGVTGQVSPMSPAQPPQPPPPPSDGVQGDFVTLGELTGYKEPEPPSKAAKKKKQRGPKKGKNQHRLQRTSSAASAPGVLSAGLLQLRDLRSIDSAFTISKAPAFLVRRNALVVNLYSIRAVILSRMCFFFLKQGADGELMALKSWLCSPWPADRGAEPAFEFKALEAILAAVNRVVEPNIERMAKKVEALTNLVSHASPTAEALKDLRVLKGEVAFLKNRKLSPMHKVLADVLDTPVDLEMAYLSRVGKQDPSNAMATLTDLHSLLEPAASAAASTEVGHAEVEILLEAYLMEIDSFLVKTTQLRHDLDSVESEAMLRLDVARNQHQRMEVWISLITLAVGVGAFVAGLFGMNLDSGLDTANPRNFNIVVVCTMILCVLVGLLAGCYIQHKQLLV